MLKYRSHRIIKHHKTNYYNFADLKWYLLWTIIALTFYSITIFPKQSFNTLIEHDEKNKFNKYTHSDMCNLIFGRLELIIIHNTHHDN